MDTKLKRAVAKTSCGNIGSHLAVPRSQEENQCVLDLIQTGIVHILGIEDIGTSTAFIGVTKKDGEYEGDDGPCGDVPAKADWWGPLQPTTIDLFFDIILTPLKLVLGNDLDFLCTALGKGAWYIAHCDSELHSVCQLSTCYQPNQS